MAKWIYEKYTYERGQRIVEVVSRVDNSSGDIKTATAYLSKDRLSYIQPSTGTMFTKGLQINYYYLYPLVMNYESKSSSFLAVRRQSSSSNSKYDVYELYHYPNSLVETLIAEEGTYPDDGIHEGFYYKKIKKAFPSLKLNNLNIGGAKIKDSVGQMRNVGNVYFKDNTGTVRNLK